MRESENMGAILREESTANRGTLLNAVLLRVKDVMAEVGKRRGNDKTILELACERKQTAHCK